MDIEKYMPPAHALRSATGLTWLDDSGIIIAVANPHDIHTLKDAEENQRIISLLAGDIKRPFLIDISNVKSMSREARAFYAGPEPPKTITAVAIVTNSNIGNLVGNFFISLTSPRVPTRMFSDPIQAQNWLQQFKQQ